MSEKQREASINAASLCCACKMLAVFIITLVYHSLVFVSTLLQTIFIGSVDKESFPNMKAMFTPRKIEGNSMRTQQFMRNPKASIYSYHRGCFEFEGIMLTGAMEVLQFVQKYAGVCEKIKISMA